MELTHFGHSCVLATVEGVTVLFDPGSFSHGFDGITGLDAIFITHQHADHVDVDRLPALLDANPNAKLFSDPQTASQLGEAWTAVNAGDVVTVGGLQATGVGGIHATIHPDIPLIDNVGFLLGSAEKPGQLLHPGDSLFVPEQPVDVLAMPTGAPWMKVSEGVDFLRAVKPRLAFPIHEAVVAEGARPIYFGIFGNLADKSTEFRQFSQENSLTL